MHGLAPGAMQQPPASAAEMLGRLPSRGLPNSLIAAAGMWRPGEASL